MSTFQVVLRENQTYADVRAIVCPLCERPFRDPVQVTTCGHRFCRSCLFNNEIETAHGRYVCAELCVVGSFQSG